MGKGYSFLERFGENAELLEEPLPGQSIVEIAGDTRVLVENHMGVTAYAREKIVIRMKFGFLNVCGCGLEIIRMNRDQLVIRGRIHGVSLCRRGNE